MTSKWCSLDKTPNIHCRLSIITDDKGLKREHRVKRDGRAQSQMQTSLSRSFAEYKGRILHKMHGRISTLNVNFTFLVFLC